jgi:hypothetical protein
VSNGVAVRMAVLYLLAGSAAPVAEVAHAQPAALGEQPASHEAAMHATPAKAAE